MITSDLRPYKFTNLRIGNHSYGGYSHSKFRSFTVALGLLIKDIFRNLKRSTKMKKAIILILSIISGYLFMVLLFG